jgi:hypothetical protein
MNKLCILPFLQNPAIFWQDNAGQVALGVTTNQGVLKMAFKFKRCHPTEELKKAVIF